jgi:uncharacterized protein (DUF58 family)
MLTGRKRPGVRGTGAPVKRRSDGYEFAELRAYVSGDDPRRIDWAATARAGDLQTRVVFEDHALTLATALDSSASMFVGRKKTNYALATDAATFWYDAAIDDDRCACVTREGLVFARDLRGRSAARLCLDVTLSEAPVILSGAPEGRGVEGPSTYFATTLDLALAALPREAHLLIVSDFFELDALEPLLRACAARFDLTALVVRDPWHDGLPLGGFVRLRDAETGRVARSFIGPPERTRYVEAVALRERRTLGALLRMGIRAALLAAEQRTEAALFDAFGIG